MMDGHTEKGSKRLMTIIEKHWAAHGLHPHVRVEQEGDRVGYVVRSNMINGLPV